MIDKERSTKDMVVTFEVADPDDPHEFNFNDFIRHGVKKSWVKRIKSVERVDPT